jgi:hypothetical protein
MKLACLGNPDPVGMKVYCRTGKETFDDETTEEAPPRRDRGEAAWIKQHPFCKSRFSEALLNRRPQPAYRLDENYKDRTA